MTTKDAVTIEGEDEAHEKLLAWLHKMSESLENEGELRIRLVRKVRSGELPLDEFVYDYSGEIASIVDEIVEAAGDEAVNARGKVIFQIRIDGKAQGCAFTLKVPRLDEEDPDHPEDFTEAPTHKGLVEQSMRHAEVFAKEAMAAHKGTTTVLMKQIEYLTNENIALKRQQFESMKLVEELRNMSFARELETDKFKREEARKDKAVANLGQVVPILAHRFLGPGGAQAMTAMAAMAGGDNEKPQVQTQRDAPQSPAYVPFARSEVEIMIEQLFDGLREDQVIALAGAGILELPQLALLKSIHEAVLKRREVEAAAKKAAEAAAQEAPIPPGPTGRAAANRWGYNPQDEGA